MLTFTNQAATDFLKMTRWLFSVVVIQEAYKVRTHSLSRNAYYLIYCMQDNFLRNSLLYVLSSMSGDQVTKRISAQYSLPFWRKKNDDDVNSGIYGRMAVILFLVVNNRRPLLSRHFLDAATYWPKVAQFSYLQHAFEAPVSSDPVRISLRRLVPRKPERCRYPKVKGLYTIRLTVLPQYQRVQNRQTDKQTDGIAISRIVFMTKCGRAIKTDSMCKYQ